MKPEDITDEEIENAADEWYCPAFRLDTHPEDAFKVGAEWVLDKLKGSNIEIIEWKDAVNLDGVDKFKNYLIKDESGISIADGEILKASKDEEYYAPITHYAELPKGPKQEEK